MRELESQVAIAQPHGACEWLLAGISSKDGAVSGVTTDRGHIECEKVINCVGQWARKLGQMAGVSGMVVPPLGRC